MLRYHYNEISNSFDNEDIFSIFASRNKNMQPVTRRTTEQSMCVRSRSPSLGLPQSSQDRVANTSKRSSSITREAMRPCSPMRPKTASAMQEVSVCRYCHRRYYSDRIEEHEEICSRSTKEKRIVYNEA